MIDGTEINAIRTPKREKSLWPGRIEETCLQELGYELERTEGFGRAKRREKRMNGEYAKNIVPCACKCVFCVQLCVCV